MYIYFILISVLILGLFLKINRLVSRLDDLEKKLFINNNISFSNRELDNINDKNNSGENGILDTIFIREEKKFC